MHKFLVYLSVIFFGFLGIAVLRHSGDFWRQLPTFLWDRVEVVVISNELKDSPRRNGPMGSVHFKIVGRKASSIYSDHLCERYDFGDVPAKTAAFIARFAPGTVHTGYVAPDNSRVSIGHFPRFYGVDFVLSGMSYCFVALILWWRLRKATREAALLQNSAGAIPTNAT